MGDVNRGFISTKWTVFRGCIWWGSDWLKWIGTHDLQMYTSEGMLLLWVDLIWGGISIEKWSSSRRYRPQNWHWCWSEMISNCVFTILFQLIYHFLLSMFHTFLLTVYHVSVFSHQMVQLDRTVIRQTQTSLYTWILRLWTNNPLEIRESATLHHHSFFESKQSFNPTESQNDLSNTCQLSYTLHLQSRGNWLHLIIPYTNE